MQFRVPQFIDMEDKVIGPLTLKQFAYILGAGGFSFLIWTFIPIKLIALPLIIAVAGLFIALAFVKINNRSFGEILESAFTYYTSNKVYTWKQPGAGDISTEVNDPHIEKVVADATKEVTIAKANQGKLHDIALGLDVYEHVEDLRSDEK
jgi:hypothetical protein